MPIATRNQIIIAAANDLTTALFTKHDNIILPLVVTNIYINLLNLAVNSTSYCHPIKEVTDVNPIDNAKTDENRAIPNVACSTSMGAPKIPSTKNRSSHYPTSEGGTTIVNR